MKTIVVLAALAAVALAAPSAPGDRTPSLRSWPREKKSPTFGKLKGHHETEYHHHHHEPEYHHHHVPSHHLVHPVPVHHGYGHGHHIFREDEKAAEDTKTTCAKEVAAKCGEKEAASEKEALILTSTEEKQMRMIEEHERTLDTGIHTNIQAARLALDKMQQNLEEMERSAASPKMQWKHADSKSDLSLHADIESARSALANVQKNIDELHNINEDTVASVALREADIETSEFEKMTEEERMAQWKEAIETIERNVEIADNIKKSFASDNRKTINDHQKSAMMKESENIESHHDKNNKGKEMEMSASETSEVRSMKTVEHKPTLSLKPESLISKLTEERTSISPAIKSDKINTEAIDTEAKLPLAKSSEITKEESTVVHNDAGNLHLIKEKEAEVVAEKKLDDTLDHTTLARENTKHLQLMKVKDAELKENEDAKLLHDQHKTSNLPREDVSIDFLRSHNDEHITHIEKKDDIHMNHGSTPLARENIASEKKGPTKNIKNNEAHNDMEHHESKTNIVSMKAAVADETPSKLNVQATLSNTDKIENTQAILPHGKNAEVASMHGITLDHEMKHTKLSEDSKPLSMKAASSDVPHGRFADDMDMSMNMKAASSGMAPTHEMTPIRNSQKQELNRNIDFNQRATGMSSFDHFHGHADQMKAEPSEKLRSLSEKSSGGWRKHESSRNAYGPSVAAAPAGYGGGAAAGAVGVFPNAHVGNCAVPLLLSCSPSVVSGHLAKAHHAGYGSSAGGYGGSSHAAAAVSSGGYGAPAHAAPAGYGAPAAHAAPAGYGAPAPALSPAPALAPAPLSYSPYRSSEDLTDFSFHNKRDVKKMAPKVRRSQKALSRNY